MKNAPTKQELRSALTNLVNALEKTDGVAEVAIAKVILSKYTKSVKTPKAAK